MIMCCYLFAVFCSVLILDGEVKRLLTVPCRFRRRLAVNFTSNLIEGKRHFFLSFFFFSLTLTLVDAAVPCGKLTCGIPSVINRTQKSTASFAEQNNIGRRC